LLRAPAEVPIWADPLRIEQVVTNLLDNAIKYSPEGGPIEVDVDSVEPGTVRLAVRDHGIGVPPEHRGQIFERFYQAETVPTKHASGMGLGLYISRQIVELHDGRIAAEFPPDGGTRFVVTLPTGADRSVCGA
jgi:signal transduction histidine kinase